MQVPCPHSTLCPEMTRLRMDQHKLSECPFRPSLSEEERAKALADR